MSFIWKIGQGLDQALPFKRINMENYKINFIKLFIFENREFLSVCGDNDQIAIFEVNDIILDKGSSLPFVVLELGQ
jgi:hypothetical protein